MRGRGKRPPSAGPDLGAHLLRQFPLFSGSTNSRPQHSSSSHVLTDLRCWQDRRPEQHACLWCGKTMEYLMTFDTGLESIRCPVCGLVQFCTLSTICKRCRSSLGIRYATLNLSRKNLEKDNSSEEFTRAFGRMLRGMRLERKLTQAEFALRLHTSRSQLSRLETGRHSPSFSMLIRAALVFSIDRAILRLRVPSKSLSKS